MLARHIHQFFADEDHWSSSAHLVNTPRAPPAGPTGDAQVAPAADEGRGRVSVPEGRFTSPIHHLHPLRPRLHFHSILPVGHQQQGVTMATGLEPLVSMETTPVRGYLVIRHRAGRSYRNNLVNSLMAQHTCLHSSALDNKQTRRYHGYLRRSSTWSRPPHLVTCLWKSVSCLWVTVMAPPDVSLGKPLRACSNQRQKV